MVRTSNRVFNKIMHVLTALMMEVNELHLEAENELYPVLAMFGERADDETMSEGEIQLEIGRLFPFLQKLSAFVERTYDVVRNFVRQLASLFHPKQELYQSSFKGVHMVSCFRSLAQAFTILITLDELIQQNYNLQTQWQHYKRMMKTIKLEPQRYDMDENTLRQMEKFVLKMEGDLLCNMIFQTCIEQEFDYIGLVEVRTNTVLQNEFSICIQQLLADFADKIGDTSETNERSQFVGFCGLYAFYFYLFRNKDEKKLFKAVWEMYKQVPLVHLYGSSIWLPAEFLKNRVPQMVKTISNTKTSSFYSDLHKSLQTNFVKDTNQMYTRVCTWMVRMESNLSTDESLNDILLTRMSLFIKGVVLANQINTLLKTEIFMHQALEAAYFSSHVRCIGELMEMLKSIEFTFHRRSNVIANNLSYMVQQISIDLQLAFSNAKQRMSSSRKFTDAKTDALSAVTVAINMLSGVVTHESRLVLNLAIEVLKQGNNVFKDHEWQSLDQQLTKLGFLSDLQMLLRNGCDTSFMYFSRDMFPAMFEEIYERPEKAAKLQYLVTAMRDPVILLKSVIHFEDNNHLLQKYIDTLETNISETIVKPLCLDIETDLRLHIHSHLQVSERNPYQTGMKDLSRFLKIRPLPFFDKWLDLKAQVVHYLDTMFYNLTTLTPQDWKTYEEMRNLALEKYGLKMAEVFLPGATLEQGLDVLEIMRNIHIFVAKYNYNLNNQIFIERSSDNKHLHTINIRHIANSIRTHGTGIMNTTVNFTYHFLRQKFVIFSQFLFDDQIKSRLINDIKFYKTKKEELNNQYPFERAEQFNKGIRKLGVTDEGLSFLDQFRILITEIGNALGYVRMIRAGGLHYCANAIRFIPDLGKIIEFKEQAEQVGFPERTLKAAENLDTCIQNLSENFSEGTEYLKMLVNVFASSFRNQQNKHLQNFYIIVPPLMINWCTHMLVEKEKLNKKGKEAAFTDDGFAIGVAYILKLLDQNDLFDSLHWFDSVHDKFIAEQNKHEETMAKKKRGEEESVQSLRLTLRKLQTFEAELELLFYSFTGARVFFKDTA
eukprot:TRINITY_DN3625_c0_g1_i4.p1 TRINITY_DN3625_c0_g1~~TRINITY_DN3625_c0_g1_i4.p1  ORF type:complete len:1053 (-),score=451.78 TRINITY_DN3625_c0_g1_i4:39-3197(-)